MVQSAWAVYRPLPSAERHKTGRLGQATAAPTASGKAIPIEPPVFANQSWGGAPMVAASMPRPEVMDSSTTRAFSGRVAPTAAARPGKDRKSVVEGTGAARAGRHSRSKGQLQSV